MDETGTEVLEIERSALSYSREHALDDSVTLEVWSQGDKFKIRLRIGGNLGKRLSAKRSVRSRKKGLTNTERDG
jgi:hypothetical protein